MMSANLVMVVVGTRPEIIKMAPVIRALQKTNLPFLFVHCGQHYDYNMSQQFIDQLQLPTPDYGYKVKTRSQGVQTARILTFIERLLKRTLPQVVLVEGDTNSVLATALATVKLGIPIGHVEAGLRSFDLRMPEEHNRRLTDHVSSYLFAPTTTAENNLKTENVWGKIYVTGNTIIDAVTQHLPIAEQQSKILETIPFDKFALATAHRAENVDDPTVLLNIMDAFAEAPIPIVYPLHPRTRQRLRHNKFWQARRKWKNITFLPPLGYFDFLILMKNSELILTDSGGIQEEATAQPIHKKVLVLRSSTERPEAVTTGFAELVGTEKQTILKALKVTLETTQHLRVASPYGDGRAGERIVNILRKELSA